MERILEPEYMDTVGEAESYDAMDHTAPNEDLVASLLAIDGGAGRILDIGTGPGHIPMLLARASDRCIVVGIDAAGEMLRLAARRCGEERRIHLHRGDAKRLPYRNGSFDSVLSNTILHHIPEPMALLQEACRVLRPDGALLIRDLCRPVDEATAWKLVQRHAAAATKQQQQLLFDSLHAALTIEEVKELVAAVGLTGATVTMTSDRHYTISRPPLRPRP